MADDPYKCLGNPLSNGAMKHISNARTQGLKMEDVMEQELSRLISKALELETEKDIRSILDLVDPRKTPGKNLWPKDLFSSMRNRSAQQFVIDFSLKKIAVSLDSKGGLFKQQSIARDEIERQVVRNKVYGSVPRNYMRIMLSKEKEIAKEISEKKKLFDDIVNLAEKLGFEVFIRSENKYKTYIALEVNYEEIVRYMSSQSA
ncbi:MAG: hypothetical protein M5R37_02170 [Melioribacteraceae bacterium]|nr:hypothetical protein [Melioribacteraceae bacterium]